MYTDLYIAKDLDLLFTNTDAQALACCIVAKEEKYIMRVRREIKEEEYDKGTKLVAPIAIYKQDYSMIIFIFNCEYKHLVIFAL